AERGRLVLRAANAAAVGSEEMGENEDEQVLKVNVNGLQLSPIIGEHNDPQESQDSKGKQSPDAAGRQSKGMTFGSGLNTHCAVVQSGNAGRVGRMWERSRHRVSGGSVEF